MIKKLMLVTGFGAGYVLGAKAGTQRYEQIVAKAREVAGMPAVQGVTDNLTQTASGFSEAAKAKANDTIGSVNGKVSGGSSSTPATADTIEVVEVVDLTPGTSTSGYDTGAAPKAGAAPSDTV